MFEFATQTSKFFLKSVRSLIIRNIFKSNFQDTFISNDFGFKRGTPIDRYYINDFLKKSSDIFIGDALEFGDTNYLDRFDDKLQNKFIFNYSENHYTSNRMFFGDISKPDSLPFGTFDTIICINVLNFIFDISSALNGLHKMLKVDGRIILTVAGVASHISRYDMERWGDYWRFTDLSIEAAVTKSGFEIDKLTAYGNPYACSAQINGLSLEDLVEDKIMTKHKDYQLLIALVLRKAS